MQKVFSVYGLINPETGKYFYVGVTELALKRRLNGHMNSTDPNIRKRDLIQALRSKEIRPEIKLLETVTGTGIHGAVKAKEVFWTKKLLAEGHELLNVNYILRAKDPWLY